MTLQWPYKDPGEILDYSVDWSNWLGTDTIASSSWVVPTGITASSNSHTTTVATVWLGGGTVGKTYTLLNQITTAGNLVSERSVNITIRSK